MEFQTFPKIPRLNRTCVVTEKIDGTNGQLYIVPKGTDAAGLFDTEYGIQVGDATIFAGSQNRWVSYKEDNHGFFKWAAEHAEDLVKQLGFGQHFGEWWGSGINKRYAGAPKQFSLFNTHRWLPAKEQGLLSVCNVVPVLYQGNFDTKMCNILLVDLKERGSRVWPGAEAEGIIVYHQAAGTFFKATCEKDESPKGLE